MSGLGINIESQQLYWGIAILALLIPFVIFASWRSLAGLGRWRWSLSIVLRCLLIVLLVGAFTEVRLQRTSEKMTVIYLLDQSESIPVEKREAMLDYVYEDVRRHRDPDEKDRAGIIIFGGEAKIEVPPFDEDILIERIGGDFDLRTDSTSLESALKLAKASFQEDSSRRVVIVSDGNENLGDAAAIARSLTEDGIGIDCVAVSLEQRSEVWIEKIAVPSDIRRGQRFDTHVIINNDAIPGDANPSGEISGTVRLTRSTQSDEELVGTKRVALTPGKNVVGFEHEIDRSAMFTYRAVFEPDNPELDYRSQNNEATAFTHVRGKGRVLLIEDWTEPGQFNFLVDRLRQANIEVKVMPSNDLFTSPADLLEFDTVILANVSRASGENSDEASNFSDQQIQMLVNNTEEMGAGLVMLGGPNSFGAGGWINTELEKAMPVDFKITNKEVRAVGALVLLMHASEMDNGNYWQKQIGKAAVETLGPMDYCGLIEWHDFRGVEEWGWKLPSGVDQVGGNKRKMLGVISKMTPGDMPYFEPAMQLALLGFSRTDAATKHMIIISDGDPTPPRAATMKSFVDAGIMVTTVAIGTHGPAGSNLLQDIAKQTGGRYYLVRDPKKLPKIYQREARRVSRSLIFESDENGINVVGRDGSGFSGITSGIRIEDLPPIRGYVLTTIKDSPLVEQILVADQPEDNGENTTLLASWRYGLGRATVWTSDTGRQWTDTWVNQEYYDKFFTQMVRDSMRPISEDANFMLASQLKDGKGRVVITALDENDEFLDFLNMAARGVGPGLEGFDIPIRQVAPGRYEGEFDASESGSYLFSVIPGEGYQRLSAGLSVPYSSEFNDRETNLSLLETLVNFHPVEGENGILVSTPFLETEFAEVVQAKDSYRDDLPRAFSLSDIWPLLILIAALLFVADVFVRRVSVGFEWYFAFVEWVKVKFLRRDPTPQVEERLTRLQNQKSQLKSQMDQQRASLRFEPTTTEAQTESLGQHRSVAASTRESQRNYPTSEGASAGLTGGVDATTGDSGQRDAAEIKAKKSAPNSKDSKSADESYTSRLLAAKRKAQQKNDSDD